MRHRVNTLEIEVEELRAEVDVKNQLLRTADISRSDGDRTEQNTPSSSKLSNSINNYCKEIDLYFCPYKFILPGVHTHDLLFFLQSILEGSRVRRLRVVGD